MNVKILAKIYLQQVFRILNKILNKKENPMKKNCFLFAIILSILFLSCSENSFEFDEHGCYLSLEAAKTQALKSKKEIVLLITTEDEDTYSSEFVNTVVKDENFKNEMKDRCIFVHFDFSEKSFQKAALKEDMSEKEIADTEKFSNVLQKNYNIASIIEVEYTPALYIFSKEGYLISEMDYEEPFADSSEFADFVDVYLEVADDFEESFLVTETGTDLERVYAIDELYNAAPVKSRYFMIDLARNVIELDKNNETGLVSKYMLSVAEYDALNCWTQGDVQGALQAYLNIAKSDFLSDSEKQQAYYTAAYLLATSGSADYDLIISYLENAIKILPDGENSDMIEQALDYIKSLKDDAALSESDSLSTE